jgi:hypothetical protein
MVNTMKWIALLLTILLYTWTWIQILPEDADLPPCHMMPFLLASSLWTAHLFLRRKKHYPPGHCQKCGYDLTGNVSGRCPECGTPIEREGKPA